MLVGVGAVLLSSAPVLAAEASKLDDMAEQLVDQDLASSRTTRVDRWGFGFAGPDRVRAAAEHCSGTSVGSAAVRHTGGDVAAAFFSLGVYTPVHLTYSCSPTAKH
jgi:hypothetical protein